MVFLHGNFFPADKWKFAVGGTYSISESGFDPIDMDLPEEIVEHADYDFGEVNEYSDLKFKQLELWAKGSREILERASVYMGVGYFDLQDEEPYIYGDQSGEVAYVQTGLQVTF